MKIYLTHYRTASTTYTELLEDIAYPQRVHWFPELYARAKTGMFYVPHKLAEKVLDPVLMQEIRENKVGKTAFILAGGNAHFAGINQRPAPDNRLNYIYKFLPFTLTQVYAGRTAQMFGDVDYITTDASACASSLKALMDVQTMIKFYGYDRVIVLSVEDAISNTVLEFFGESNASLNESKKVEQNIEPSAFDSKNQGFYVGQGAVLAVFESERARSAIGHAMLMSAFSASESSTNAIGQLENGEGYGKAIKGALALADALPEDIKIVKTHGTGTESNNKAEKAALEGIPDFIATSYKQKIGHTMGASGLLETCLLLDDMKSGIVPKIENRTEKDNVFLSDDTKAPSGYILSLAAGMGNIYSAAILEAI